MDEIRWTGTQAELDARIAQLTDVLNGRASDPGGCVKLLLIRVGLVLLEKVKEAYVQASQGGADAWGNKWPALAPATLAARRIGSTSDKALQRLKERYKKLPAAQRRQIDEHAKRLHLVFNDKRAKAAAVRVLDRQLLSGKIDRKAYDKRVRLIERGTSREQAKFIAAASWAQILRDTGRLLNSLSPQFRGSGDQIFNTLPGSVEVGSNVKTDSGPPLLALHTSPDPRKLKADGNPVLPRRKVLPDNEQDMPQSWLDAISDEVTLVMASREFWLAFLGSKAA